MNMLWFYLGPLWKPIAGGIGLLVAFFSVKGMVRADEKLKQVLAEQKVDETSAKVRRDVRDLGVAGVRDGLRRRDWRPNGE